jgi:hypothetical protein
MRVVEKTAINLGSSLGVTIDSWWAKRFQVGPRSLVGVVFFDLKDHEDLEEFQRLQNIQRFRLK